MSRRTVSRRTAAKDRISFPHKVAYGIGGFVNNLLAQGIGSMMVVLTLALGMDFRAVGLLGSLPRFFDAVTDPLVGFLSDKTRSRWGRRRPFLFVGAVASGIIFALLWQMPAPTQFRLKLVDYGADGVYSGGETGEPVGLLESIGNSLKDIVTVEINDDVEDEVTILPPALVTGGWVSLDVPLADFDQLATREHLSQILISGDLTEVYVDNVYLYRSDDTTRAEPAGQDVEGVTAPNAPGPTPTVPAEDVISFFSGAYDDVPVQFWSTAWDESDVADAQAGGNDVKHYTGMRFAAIDFGETPVDARGMTHIHLDIWTPEPTAEGRSQGYYFWYFLIGSLVFFLAYTVFATPWVALGYELTPDYNERTRLMGVQNFVSNIAFVIGPWFLVIMTNAAWFRNQMAGARFLALAICVVTIALGVIPAIFLRERMHAGGGDADADAGADAPTLRDSVKEFLRGLWQTVKTGPFLMLCIATFLIFNSFIMISQFQFWVFAFYISGGEHRGGRGSRRTGRHLGDRRGLPGDRHRHLAGNEDREEERVLRVDRHFDVRLRAEVVLLQPGLPDAGAAPRPVPGLRTGGTVHADGVDDRGRGGPGRTHHRRAARGDVRIGVLVGGQGRPEPGNPARRIPALLDGAGSGAWGQPARGDGLLAAIL